MIKFVSDLQKVGGFLLGTLVSSANKTDHHDITVILLKVALNTINPNPEKGIEIKDFVDFTYWNK